MYKKASDTIKQHNMTKNKHTNSYRATTTKDNIQTIYQLMQDEMDDTMCYLVIQKRDLTKWDDNTQSYGKLLNKLTIYNNIECDIKF